MNAIFLALNRSFSSLSRGRILFYLLLPPLLAILLMIALSLFLLTNVTAVLMAQPWLVAWGAAAWLAHLIASISGWLLILSASYLLSVLLTAIAVLPWLLGELAATDYADLAPMGTEGFITSTLHNIWAAILFVLGTLITLPLWVIPGLDILLSFFWMAWLNQRTFAYDALSLHAAPDEWQKLKEEHAKPFFGLGALMAAFTHFPLMGLFAPSFAALAYIHYSLEALRCLRKGAIVSIHE